MEKEELDKIITQLESSNSVKDAYFSIEQYGGGPDECFIKSNKEGLELIASELLKSSRDSDKITDKKDGNYLSLEESTEYFWTDGDVFIDHIELVTKIDDEIIESNTKQNLRDKVTGVLLFIVLIIIVLSIFVGLGTMISWLF